MRHLVETKVKPGEENPLLAAIESGTLDRGSVAGDEYFDLLRVKDAHARTNCRDANGTEPWACCNCDCTEKLERRLQLVGESFLSSLKQQTSGAS
jgi:hypothetical protein